MRKSITTLLGATALVITLAACGGGTPPVTPPPVTVTVTAEPEAPEETPTEEPTAEEKAESTGTREAPLAPGEARKLANDSAWTVSLGATEVHDAYITAPLTIGIDWANLHEQHLANGDPADTPANPFWSVSWAFVTADGTTYDSMDDYTVDIPNDAFQVGDVYEPATSASGGIAVSVPKAEVEGGTWVLSNNRGDRVFVAIK